MQSLKFVIQRIKRIQKRKYSMNLKSLYLKIYGQSRIKE